jgi:hypothetical protein
MALTVDMGEPWKQWLRRQLEDTLFDLKRARRQDAYRKRYPTQKAWLQSVGWEGILAEHMYFRVPLKDTVPELLPYQRVAKEYLTENPNSVADAIDAAIETWGDRADIDDVMQRLVPPLLEWAREEKGLELNDHEGSLYPTRWRPPKPDD